MKDFFVQTLETVLNRYLMLDPESQNRFNRLERKIITIELLLSKEAPLSFQLKMLNGKIYLQQAVEVHDVLIQGSPLSLLHVSLAKNNRKQFFADNVSIQGDLELGQQVLDLFDELEIDWEEHLSKLTGDVAAHQIGKVVRSAKRLFSRTQESILQNVNEYVHEEINFFPAAEALQDFFQEIDDLRMDVDRLEQRLANLRGTV